MLVDKETLEALRETHQIPTASAAEIQQLVDGGKGFEGLMVNENGSVEPCSVSGDLTNLVGVDDSTIENRSRTATIDISGVITEKTLTEVRSLLRGRLKNSNVRVILDTPGGAVYPAVSIYNELKQHPHQVDVVLRGRVASAGTIIAQGATPGRRFIENTTSFMSHEIRPKKRDIAGLYGQVNTAESIARKIYESNGAESTAIDAAFSGTDQWMQADSAVKAGFADQVIAVGSQGSKIAATDEQEIYAADGVNADDIVAALDGEILMSAEQPEVVENEAKESVELVAGTTLVKPPVRRKKTVAPSNTGEDMEFQQWLENRVGSAELVATLTAEQTEAFKGIFAGEQVAAMEPVPAPSNLSPAIQKEIEDGKRIARVRELCGDNIELKNEALVNEWSDELIEAKVHSAKVDAQLAAIKNDTSFGGEFNALVDAGKSGASIDAVVSAICMSQGVPAEFLMEPNAEAGKYESDTHDLTAIAEKDVAAGAKHYAGTLQELAAKAAYMNGNQGDETFRDSTVNAGGGLQNSYSRVSIPKSLIQCTQFIAADEFRRARPKWDRFARGVSVESLDATQVYHMNGTGGWDKKPACGELTHGEIELNLGHTRQAETVGQVLEICDDLFLRNNGLGTIADISRMFGRTGAYAPERAMWKHITSNFCTDNKFEFSYENMKNLWKSFCRKGQYEPNPVSKDKYCEDFAHALEVEDPVILVSKCEKEDLMALIRGVTSHCGGPDDCVEVSSMQRFENMFQVCDSSYMPEGCMLMLPGPTSGLPAFEIAFHRNRRTPIIERRPLPIQKLGFGIRGYLRFGVNSAYTDYICNAGDVLAGVDSPWLGGGEGEKVATEKSASKQAKGNGKTSPPAEPKS